MNEVFNRPYDLSSPQELKDALLHTASAYVDYLQYYMRLSSLLENFDETLEHSDFSSWIRLGSDPESVDNLTYDAIASLRNSADLLDKVADRARRNLILVMKTILASPPDIQALVWVEAYDVPIPLQDSLLEKLFDEMIEVKGAQDLPYSMSDALDVFLSFFHDFMKAHKNES